MTEQEWAKPTPREVTEFVLQVVEQNPERHNQRQWVGNVFTRGENALDVKEMLRHALAPVPETPENPDQPYCGTTGCVAGWAVAYGSQPGTMLVSSYISGYCTLFPDGTQVNTSTAASDLMGLNEYQADWLFDEYRTHEEVTSALHELLENPAADISGQNVRKFTVKVFDADGNEMYAAPVYADDGDYTGDNTNAKILYKAYSMA